MLSAIILHLETFCSRRFVDEAKGVPNHRSFRAQVRHQLLVLPDKQLERLFVWQHPRLFGDLLLKSQNHSADVDERRDELEVLA